MDNMAKKGKTGKKGERSAAIFFRPEPEDYNELERRRATTGAPLGAQVRIIIHEALHSKKGRIQ